jgi:hypothetical protein
LPRDDGHWRHGEHHVVVKFERGTMENRSARDPNGCSSRRPSSEAHENRASATIARRPRHRVAQKVQPIPNWRSFLCRPSRVMPSVLAVLVLL